MTREPEPTPLGVPDPQPLNGRRLLGRLVAHAADDTAATPRVRRSAALGGHNEPSGGVDSQGRPT
jgi:hypothetical protein